MVTSIENKSNANHENDINGIKSVLNSLKGFIIKNARRLLNYYNKTKDTIYTDQINSFIEQVNTYNYIRKIQDSEAQIQTIRNELFYRKLY